jgi:hypothetical protein
MARRVLLLGDDDAAKRVETQTVAADGTGQKQRLDCIDDFPVACEESDTVDGRCGSLLSKGRKFRLVWHDKMWLNDTTNISIM